MGADAIRSEKRGRKRRREVSENVDQRRLVGRHVRKEFKGLGVFSGKIVRDRGGGLYRVHYEDGDSEDLEYDEILRILVDDAGGCIGAGAEGLTGNEELGLCVPGKSGEGSYPSGVAQEGCNLNSDSGAGSDADSSAASGKSEICPIMPLLLPQSSGSIGVGEESVIYLFSVYNFLRSFSHQLFLSPFSLDDFVGSLNYPSANSLLDAVHLALLRALRRHLEAVNIDGNGGLASICLRCLDWSLLDSLTWTVYVTEYLHVMGYTKGKDWMGFYDHVLNREYYSLPVHTKLKVLQILCDDLLEFAELRTEINSRECGEEGFEIDDTAMPTAENGPRRVHPRYSKTSACKGAETIENIVDPCNLKLTYGNSNADSCKLSVREASTSDIIDDGNSDECKLCGMDGVLLCCDGCPFAYHARCIGLTKASIPAGQWFCPECIVNNVGPVCSRFGKGLRGADVFGIDPFGRLFMGTCNYIIVLETPTNTEPICRYYSHNDVLKLLRVFYSSGLHASQYSEICKGILQYYEISEDAILVNSLLLKTEREHLNGDREMKFSENHFDGEQAKSGSICTMKNRIPLSTIKQENGLDNGIVVGMDDITAISGQENGSNEVGGTGSTIDSCNFTDLSQQKDAHCASEYAEMPSQQFFPIVNTQSPEQLGTDSTKHHGFQISSSNHYNLTCRKFKEEPILLEIGHHPSVDAASTSSEDPNRMVSHVKNDILSTSLEKGPDHFLGESESDRDRIDTCSCTGASFKPQDYVNQYIPGDLAASAAANLAVLTSESCKAAEVQSSDPKKAASENFTLQMKAFSGVVSHFQWPNFEKKLRDIQKEKCGWCITCKFPGMNRRGCLLNLSISNALKGDFKATYDVRSIRSDEGKLSAIAAFILKMEESLRGLTIGLLSTVSYRREWCKRLQQATCESLKYILLDLEENINVLAFSSGWVKPADDWSFKLATAQFGTYSIASTQKRGPSTRRYRKQSSTSDAMTDSCWKHVQWRRGGKLSKLLFHTGILPRAIVKKAARQGGYKRISGIQYGEGSEFSRKSKRFAWRAAVELSKNPSQLALQVRCLDAHIRWSDIVRPELNSQDGKGLDTENSAFKNAFICGKRVLEGRTCYALSFGNQKHLPSRVMKNVIELEQQQNSKQLYWFSENHIPLYLLKDYEGKAEKTLFPPLKEPPHLFLKISRRQLRAQEDIFSYLLQRDDIYSCALCHQDVLLRNAVQCNACQGYCHKDCSVHELNNEYYLLHTCKQCFDRRSRILNMGSYVEQHEIISGEDIQKNNFHGISSCIENVEASRKKQPSITAKGNAKKKGSSLSLGLIWKKKSSKFDSGVNFRLKNILLQGSTDINPPLRPVCSLCTKPYDPSLTYIRCENCSVWYHADAVQLKEEDIFKLEGFKCCKCRRKVTPVCPYMSEERKCRMKTTKKHSMERNQNIENNDIAEQSNSQLMNAEAGDLSIDEFDPLLFSLENVEVITDDMLEVNPELDMVSGCYENPQKVPVHEVLVNDPQDLSAYRGKDPEICQPNLFDVREDLGEDFPVGCELDDFRGESTEDIEFEPQTYFSFTELLEAGDDKKDEPLHLPTDVPEHRGSSSGCELGKVEEILSYSSYEACDMGIVNAHHGHTAAEPTVNLVPCGMCSHIEPVPELLCEICGLQIHSHCSPWEEHSSSGPKWRCGRCRDWR